MALKMLRHDSGSLCICLGLRLSLQLRFKCIQEDPEERRRLIQQSHEVPAQQLQRNWEDATVILRRGNLTKLYKFPCQIMAYTMDYVQFVRLITEL